MSASRRSFPGIAQAWIARGNGKQKPIVIVVNTLSVICDINFLGDINPIITLSVTCDLQGENVDAFVAISADCSIAVFGDINPVISLSLFCFVAVSNP